MRYQQPKHSSCWPSQGTAFGLQSYSKNKSKANVSLEKLRMKWSFL